MSLNLQVSLVLVALTAFELALLRRGQRRLFWATATATRSRLIAYLLAAPGTVLHEASHYLACLALGVPVLGRPRLFWPQRDPQGDVILGSVPHARTDPLRQATISMAPLVLVPALLTLTTAVLISPQALTQLPDALTAVPWWRAALWVYLSLSCGQAVFPSPGDRIGMAGLLAVGGSWGLRWWPWPPSVETRRFVPCSRPSWASWRCQRSRRPARCSPWA